MHFLFQKVLMVRLELGSLDDGVPFRVGHLFLLHTRVDPVGRRYRCFDRCSFQEKGIRVVALEVAGIDQRLLKHTLMRQPHDHPVAVVGRAVALGLPAIAHVHATAGHQEVVHVAEEHVVALDGERAVLCGSQVHQFRGRNDGPVALRFAVHAETRHAAIRIDVELDVGCELAGCGLRVRLH